LYRSAGFDNNILRDGRRSTAMSSRRISIPAQYVDRERDRADMPLTRNRNPGVGLI
jgi:hypothetical protein